jgi:hypothetical protein
VADFFGTGIQNLIPRHDKCLNSGGDYVVKQLKYVSIFFLYIIKEMSLFACFVNRSLEFIFRICLVLVNNSKFLIAYKYVL